MRERQLIEFAASRSRILFTSHGDGQHFESLKPELLLIMQAARAEGRKVLIVEELGSVRWPADAQTGEYPPARMWLDQIEKDPVRTREWFDRKKVEAAQAGEKLLHGEEPIYDQGEGGGFRRAWDTFILEHRDIIAGWVMEAITWETHLLSVRIQAANMDAREAFREGKPDEAVALVQSVDRLKQEFNDLRDRMLIRQIGLLIEERERDRVVVLSYRGLMHWSMVQRFGLRATPPNWKKLWEEETYGLDHVQQARLEGRSIPEDGLARLRLLEVPSQMLVDHLLESGLAKERRAADKLVAKMNDDPRVTLEALRLLSKNLAGTHFSSDGDRSLHRAVFMWFVEQGVILPQ